MYPFNQTEIFGCKLHCVDSGATKQMIYADKTFGEESKLYIPSTINIWKKVLTKAIWAVKNGLVSGRLACTSTKSEIRNKIGI